MLCGHGKLMTSRKGLLASELPERYGEESCRKVKAMRKRVGDERSSRQEMEEAIRVTEERLEALKVAVRHRDKKGGKAGG